MRRNLGAALAGASITLVSLLAPAGAAAATPPQISVVGNHLVDNGATIQLRGADRTGLEYTCVSPKYGVPGADGITLGPLDQREVDGMLAWGINSVRIPLNEDCWLGINPVRQNGNKVRPIRKPAQARRAGRSLRTRYRAAVTSYVSLLESNGIVPIVDLHWTAPGSTLAASQYRAPDAEHSIPFWRSVARTFHDDHSIVFDIFNEPLDISWSCLRDGCRVPNSCADCPSHNKPHGHYRSVGTQKLVDVIRATGATQPLMIPGLAYTSDLTRWSEFLPTDPLNQLVASFHNYHSPGYPEGDCGVSCLDSMIAPIATTRPVVTGEFGEFDCDSAYSTAFMNWADDHGVSYLAWAWVELTQYDAHCADGEPEIVSDWTGTPIATGVAIRQHYRARAGLPPG